VIFRREPLHKKLAREVRVELAEEAKPDRTDPGPHWSAAGIHGVPRPRRWDAVGSVEAPALTGDEVHFVALPNRELVVDEDEPDGALAPLAEALEQGVSPPYRAEAVRRGERVWAVAARRIEVAEFDADADELELTATDGERVLTVDGERAFGSVPELERIGSRAGAVYVVRARRLDGRVWEVDVAPL
jgi:hypothetical protein